MRDISRNILAKLWDKGIRVEFALFGDGAEGDILRDTLFMPDVIMGKREKELIEGVYSDFCGFLLQKNIDVKEVNDFLPLIDLTEYAEKNPSPVPDVFHSYLKQYKDISSRVKKDSEWINYMEEIYSLMHMDDYDAICIDTCLTDADFNFRWYGLGSPGDLHERAKDFIPGEPLLSMILYVFLKETKDKNVFLYNEYRVKKVSDGYVKYFHEMYNDADGIVVYDSRGAIAALSEGKTANDFASDIICSCL